jgi:hypothetical protein
MCYNKHMNKLIALLALVAAISGCTKPAEQPARLVNPTTLEKLDYLIFKDGTASQRCGALAHMECIRLMYLEHITSEAEVKNNAAIQKEIATWCTSCEAVAYNELNDKDIATSVFVSQTMPDILQRQCKDLRSVDECVDLVYFQQSR